MTLAEKKDEFLRKYSKVSDVDVMLERIWEDKILPEMVLHPDGGVCDCYPACCDDECQDC
jgi:hypothetical protein